jgi:hypothetical protein
MSEEIETNFEVHHISTYRICVTNSSGWLQSALNELLEINLKEKQNIAVKI